MRGIVCLNSYAGRREIPVEIVGETPKKYRIKPEREVYLPGGRCVYPGETALVPKSAVRVQADDAQACLW